VIAGIDWVRANATKPAVANMSLGGGASSALDTAVRNAIASGITFSIAAGNDNANACNYSPARVAEAITVGSTTSSDSRSSFSNYGTCLDLFAPGSSITSAWTSSDTSTNTISGTSMAAPHTAGVAALILDESPSSSPAQVRDKMIAAVTTGKIVSVGSGSPNNLLYSLGGATPPPPPPATGLTNPGFESGSKVGWTESSSGGYQLVTTDRARTGFYSAWLGGYNSGTDQVYQRVTVPSGGKLSYWWRMETTESGSTVYDYLDVRLYDGVTGGFMSTLRRWTNASVKNTWSQDTLDVSAHAGKSVYVLFYVRTDSSLASSFFIDDVSLA
jgi:subtilisin family serine protease